MALPSGDIEIEASRFQLSPIPFVFSVSQEVAQTPLPSVEPGKRQADIALTSVRRVIHGHQQPSAIRVLPGVGDKSVARTIALPGRNAFKQLPLSVTHNRPPQDS